MVSWLYLPNDLIPFIRRLSQSSFESLELTEYFVKSASLEDLITYLHHQLKEISQKNQLDHAEIALFAFTSIFLKEPSTTLTLIEELDDRKYSSPQILFWHFALIAEKFAQNNQWQVDIEQFAKYREHLTLQSISGIIDIMITFIRISGDKTDWKSSLESFLEYNREFIIANINEYILFFAALNPALQSIPKEAHDLLLPLVHLSENMGYSWLTARGQHILANMLSSLGKFERCAGLWTKSLDIYDQIGYTGKYAIYLNLANHHMNLEQYRKAEEYIEKAEEGMTMNILAPSKVEIYRNLGKLDEAIELAKLSAEMNHRFIGPIFTLLELYHEKGIEDYTDEIVAKAAEIYQDHEVYENHINYLLIRAEKARYRGDFDQSQRLYRRVITECLANSTLRGLLSVYPKLVEVQFDLVKFRTDNQRYRDNLIETLDDIHLLVEEQQIPQAAIKVQLLKSEVYHFFDLPGNAKKSASNAAKLADQFDYHKLSERAEQQLARFIDEDQPEGSETGVLDRVKGMIRSLFNSNDANTTYMQVDCTIYGVMTLTSYGTSIFSKYFSDRLSSEPNLISGLITAVTSFMKEVTQSEGILQSIQHQDMTIMLEPIGDDFIFVCIVSKETLDLRNRVRKFSSKMEHQVNDYGTEIETGNVPAKFTNSVEILIDQTFEL